MATRSERSEILNLLENDYRGDLAIHLYSAILLRRINPYFPKTNWSFWPIPFSQVPVPKATFMYADNCVGNDYFGKDIDAEYLNVVERRRRLNKSLVLKMSKAWWNSQRKKKSHNNVEELNESDPEPLEEPEFEYSESEAEFDSAVSHLSSPLHTSGHSMTEDTRILEDNELQREIDGDNDVFVDASGEFPKTQSSQDQYTQETQDTQQTQFQFIQQTHEEHRNYLGDISDNSDEDERVISLKTMPIRKVTFTEMITNSKSELVNEISSTFESRIHKRITDMKQSGHLKPYLVTKDDIYENYRVKQMSLELADKLDQVLNKVSNYVTHQSQKNPVTWQHILLSALEAEDSSPYRKVESGLYVDVYDHCDDLFEKIRYNYDFDDESNENGNEGQENEEEGEESLDTSDIITSKGFSVNKYLESLKDLTATGDGIGHGVRHYKDVLQSYGVLREEEAQKKKKLRNIFENRIRNAVRTESISWTSKRKKVPSNVMPIEADFSNIKTVNFHFLNHGSTALKADSYTLRHYR